MKYCVTLTFDEHELSYYKVGTFKKEFFVSNQSSYFLGDAWGLRGPAKVVEGEQEHIPTNRSEKAIRATADELEREGVITRGDYPWLKDNEAFLPGQYRR